MTEALRGVSTPNAPAAIGPYSQAVVAPAGRLVFCSGQIPLDPQTGETLAGSIEEEAELALANLAAVLAAAGASPRTVVKTTVYMTDLGLFARMNTVYAKYFAEPFPARATVGVASLPKGARFEIDAVAIVP